MLLQKEQEEQRKNLIKSIWSSKQKCFGLFIC